MDDNATATTTDRDLIEQSTEPADFAESSTALSVPGKNEIVPTEEAIHHVSEIVSTNNILNNTLTAFVDDVCEQVRQEELYISQLRECALREAQSGGMKASELIALLTSATSNKNDLVSKVISPTMQLLAEAQRNEIQERREIQKEKEEMKKMVSPSGIRQVSDIAPSEVLIGLQALFTQATALKRAQPAAPAPDGTDDTVSFAERAAQQSSH